MESVAAPSVPSPPPGPVEENPQGQTQCPRSRRIGARPSASGRPLPASTRQATPTAATSSPRRRPSGSVISGRRTTFVPTTQARTEESRGGKERDRKKKKQ